MSRHLVEQLSGVGAIYSDDVLLRAAKYELSVWSESATRRAADPTSIEGRIDIAGMGEAIALAGADSLTLRLEDGRRLPITLVGSSGRVIGRGGFRSA